MLERDSQALRRMYQEILLEMLDAYHASNMDRYRELHKALDKIAVELRGREER